MSTDETDPPDEDVNALAGEYVLGLLDEAGLARVAALRRQDGRFEAALRAWEEGLMPLAEELTPVPPGARVWAGITAALAPVRVSSTPVRAGLWHNLPFWRWLGLGGSALAAAVIMLAVLRPVPAPMPIATAMLSPQSGGMFMATLQTSGTAATLLVSPAAVAIPANHSAELWLVRPGSPAIALGLLATSHPVLLALPPGWDAQGRTAFELAISVEPPGGSPTGAPTGPVIAAARLAPV